MLGDYLRKRAHRWMPGLAQVMLDAATWGARTRLKRQPPPLVLIDSNIRSFAITHETHWIETATGGHMARVPVYPLRSQDREYVDVTFLTSLVHLARGGFLAFRTSAELHAEQQGLPRETFHDVGWMDYNLLKGLDIPTVDGDHWGTILPSSFGPRLDPQEQQAARLAASDDPLFRSLVIALGKNNNQDAWHIRTAETHGCQYFLTMDYSLIRNLSAQSNNNTVKRLKTTVITPSDFGKVLQILPMPPLMLSYNQSSWFVHPELNSPSERRRIHTLPPKRDIS